MVACGSSRSCLGTSHRSGEAVEKSHDWTTITRSWIARTIQRCEIEGLFGSARECAALWCCLWSDHVLVARQSILLFFVHDY